MIKIFMELEVVHGEGVAVKDASSGMMGSLRDLSRNISKQGMGKSKISSKGEGISRCHHASPPHKILIIHYGCLFQLTTQHRQQKFS